MGTIQVPDKWDIIPLHTSDRGTFKSCRRRWYWSSPAQCNLIPKTSVYGIYPPFWFGDGIHYALQHFYNPLLKSDPETAFDTWYNLQWNGGIITPDELTQFADRFPVLRKDGRYDVPGLADILPDPDPDEFEGFHQLGLGMMRFYKEFAEHEDDFTVITSEHTFSVPVLDPTGAPLYMIDTRTMLEGWEPDLTLENAFGPLMREDPQMIPMLNADGSRRFSIPIEKQVHARGRMDLIVQGNSTGKYVLIDHKTVGHALTEDYFRHVDLDEQITTYIWAAEMEAKLYDLPYKDISGIIYQALRKAYPRPPTLLKSGTPSLNRATESTTAKLFEKTINELGLKPLFDADVKMQSYYTYLVEMGDKQYVWREPVIRNAAQKENGALRIYLEALDMCGSPRIYPNPTKDFSCLNCKFRQPCVALEAGYDYEAMIADNYQANYDR